MNKTRICRQCGGEMRLRMNGGTQAHFYSCLDRVCNHTESTEVPEVRAFVDKDTFKPKDPPEIEEGPSHARMLRGAAIIRAQAEQDIPHLIDVPYDDLTQAQRDEKAAYWTSKMPKSVFRLLPYDKNVRGE